MNKQQIYDYLNKAGLWHEITEHKAVYTMAELADVPTPYPEADAKNLFLRDDRREHYYLITVRGGKRVDLKSFRRAHGLRPLTFASEEELRRLLDLSPGSVTPLGILNDEARQVTVFLDRDFWAPPGLIGVHPNENTATVWLKTEDLAALIRAHGTRLETAQL